MAVSQNGGRRTVQPSRRFAKAEKKFRQGEWSLLAVNSGAEPGQLVISIPKRFVRRAVDRNAIKRQVREVFRSSTKQRQFTFDVLMIRGESRSEVGRVKGPERGAIRDAIRRLLRRIFDQSAPAQAAR